MTAARYVYLARHGEASPDESGLTDAGRRQARLLGRRLRDVPVSVIHHGPLARATHTAQLVGAELSGVPVRADESAGDYLPYVPERAELPADVADAALGFVASAGDTARARGAELAHRAIEHFSGPVDGDDDRHEVVVTHAFLVGWLLRHAMGAPPWRWLGFSPAHASLTVIRHAAGLPASVLVYNDLSHLPAELRWTGMPPALQV